MRIVSEYLYKTDQLLLRLLGTPAVPGPATNVQTGTYVIDGTPELPEIFTVDVTTDQIINNEVRLIFNGFNLKPAELSITLPDATTQDVMTVLVEEPTPTDLLPQIPEIKEPDEPPIHRPMPLPAPDRIETIIAPEIPEQWVSLDFLRTNPLQLSKTGTGSGSIAYIGGCQGRALNGMLEQPSADYAPYLIPAPTHFEGGVNNLLQNTDFSQTREVVGYLDPIPDFWDFQLADPSAMLRVNTEMIGLLPTLLLTYYKSPGMANNLSPAITMTAPNVANNQEFRAIFEPGKNNATGTIKISSFDGFVSTSPALLSGVQSCGLNVGAHGGRVRILWDQSYGDGEPQILRIACPTATGYSGAHTWTPYNTVCGADSFVANITYPQIKLDSGTVRIDSITETKATPISWIVESPSTAYNIISLSAGMLSSSLSSYAPINLAAYLATTEEPGRYSLKWLPGQNLKLLSKGLPPQGLSIPFQLDLAIPPAVAVAPIKITISSYQSNEGSGRLQFFAFSP